MTTEHKNLEYLKGRFEDGDRPTGDDFARLIDSCHNTRHITDTTITGMLSVQGIITTDTTINGRDISADGAKLDSVYNDVNTLRSTWEESDEIQGVSDRVTLIENVSSTWNATTSVVATNSAEWANHTNVDTILTELSDVRTTVDTNSAEWANHTNVDTILTELSDVRTTVNTNSADWIIDIDTNTDTDKLSDLLDVDITSVENNDVLKYNTADNTWYAARDLHGEGQHVDTFVELHDTPVSYDSGNPGEYVTIKPGGDGLMFSSLLNDIEFNRLRNDFTDIETVVENNSGSWAAAHSWGDHSQAGYITNYNETDPIFTAHVANNITQTNIDNWTTAHNWGDHGAAGYLTIETDPIFTAHVANNITQTNIDNWTTAHNWGDHGAAGYLTSYTESDPIFTAHVANNITQTNIDNWTTAHNWGDHGAAGYVTDVSDITSALVSNSGNWEDTYTHVKAVSSNWAVLDSDGVLMEGQIPELSITQTYTVQNPEEVATLNPAEGIQRGDIIIVTSTYDNLIAKIDSPAGTYDSSIKAYSGYSKLAKPDAYVTSVNDQTGHVILESDNISDVDNDNKWMTVAEKQTIEQLDDTYINVTGDTMTGDLDTTARLLSGGIDLKDAFWVRGDSLAAIDNFNIEGEINSDSYATTNTTGDKVTGITKDVNVGGNILHIVNGIIVGVTDEV